MPAMNQICVYTTEGGAIAISQSDPLDTEDQVVFMQPEQVAMVVQWLTQEAARAMGKDSFNG